MLYFAYGSNLNYDRMVSRCPSAVVVGKTILEGYRLCFMENNGGRIVANILKNKNHNVNGVLYSIIDKDLKELDICEGHPWVYKRKEVFTYIDNEKVKAYTYMMPRKMDYYISRSIKGKHMLEHRQKQRLEGIPKEEYFLHILKGYNEFKLPIDGIENIIEEVVKNDNNKISV